MSLRASYIRFSSSIVGTQFIPFPDILAKSYGDTSSDDDYIGRKRDCTRADNHPPMLEESMYNLWQSRMKLYIRGKEHDKDLIDSLLNGPFQYGMVVVDGITRPRTYEELIDKEKIRKECDIQATNIVLQGLPMDMYNLVNHHTVAKEIWDIVKLLMEGPKLSLQERISIQKLQVNTKFVNNLQPGWSKFVTNVKLARDMHESNFDKLYAYLKQHEVHANEVKMMRERFPDPLSLQAYYSPAIHQTPMIHQQPYQVLAVQALVAQQQLQAVFPHLDSGLAIPSFLPSDDPIASLNKSMAFISTTIPYVILPPTTNLGYLLIQETNLPFKMVRLQCNKYRGDRVRVLQVMDHKDIWPDNALNQKGQGMLTSQDTLTTLPINAVFQTDDLDAFDSDCDEAPSARAVLMANLSSYDSDVISKRIQPALYDGTVLAKKYDVISVIDSKETLILAEDIDLK
ncbi:hypothetical protein Tco_0955383 [Tanacetum coccineum]|uniref:Integrase, catalytic region, zinc finger, CCHC-type, peptidase aspartic, catalytic n=1 Tax=Tanacetum coccineum TaxID=301880 RepID=A0ABQ5E718_9ASTR